MEIENILTNMKIEEKVGQMFLIGFKGTGVSPEVKEMINKYHVGGVIYFSRNILSLEQTAKLSIDLQKVAYNKNIFIPMLISVDQEGGVVTRLSGVTHFPGNMTIGASGSNHLAEEAGKAVGKELKAIGINMNLAPVLDVNNNQDNPVIGVRSFGEDPELVARLGVSYIKGLQGEGVIACGKHFPGHGDTSVDSHLNLPRVSHRWERLEKVELYPFKKAIETGIDSIMTAHIYYSAIESEEKIPATLSYKVLTDLLRDRLKYNGLIVTDCMEMNAIVNNFGTVEGVIKSIEAGVDLITISHSREKQKAAIKAVVNAVKKGRISEDRINMSVKRILRVKKDRLGLNKLPSSNIEELDKKYSKNIAYRIAEEGVTLVKNKRKMIPVSNIKKKKILIIDFYKENTSKVEDGNDSSQHLVDFFNKEKINVDNISIQEAENKINITNNYDLVIFCTYNAIKNSNQVDIIKKIMGKDIPLIVIAVRNPYDILAFPDIPTYLTTYDYSQANLKVLSEIIIGKKNAKGNLPVTLKY